MLTSKHTCYSILSELQQQGYDISDDIKEILEDGTIPKRVVEVLKERHDPVVGFYTNLNNKAHKIIKESLTCDGKSVATYIKIATSLITQATIALEHLYTTDDNEAQNNFIECIGLKELSRGLNIYFETGDHTVLVKAVHNNRKDIKQILD